MGMGMDFETRIELLIKAIRTLANRKIAIEKEIKDLQSELMKLNPQKGWVELKPVRNKVGKVYHYWYYRFRENGKVRNVYLGHRIPSSLLNGFKDRARAKLITSRLRELYEELIRIERAIDTAEFAIHNI